MWNIVRMGTCILSDIFKKNKIKISNETVDICAKTREYPYRIQIMVTRPMQIMHWAITLKIFLALTRPP
jgi:hypothetical protein